MHIEAPSTSFSAQNPRINWSVTTWVALMSLVQWQPDKETGRNRRWVLGTIVCAEEELRSKLVEEFQWHLHVHVTTLCTAAVKNSLLNYFGTSVSCAARLYALCFLMQLHTSKEKQLMIFPVSAKHNWEYSPLLRNRKHQNKKGGKKEKLNVTLEWWQ